MRVVSIGDLVVDYYYKDGKLLGINGGMTSHNIIANLSKMGIKTVVYGVCGNDEQGKIAIKSLEDIGVDTKNIQILDNIKTRCFHISYKETENKLTFTSTKRCPFCNNKKWYEKSMLNATEIINNLSNEDILIFDNLNEINQQIIDKTINKKVLDLGQYFEFESLSKKTIIKKLKNKFEIINFNERVWKYLFDKLNVENDLELYDLLETKLVTITKGKKGSTFIFEGEIFDFPLEAASKEIDSTGAGDAFISSVMKEWINNNLTITSKVLPMWYKKALKLTRKTVGKMGARGHINVLYKIKNKNTVCTCNDFDNVIRKQINRCSININNLKTRVINAISSSAYNDLNLMDFKADGTYLFVGTGGSFAGANFSSKVINEMYGSNTYAILPRDVLYRNNKNVDKVIMFSYSGTTNDLIESTKMFPIDKKYIITKGEKQKIVLKTGVIKKNIISYRTNSNKGKEKGFLSFEGALAPAALFLKHYLEKEEIDIKCFICDSMDYWNEYFKDIFKQEKMKNMIKAGNIINIFRGDYTDSASMDLESKIIESGILNCIIHEKKNFSHGRFINYENLNNKNSIYFKQKNSDSYELSLLEYLRNDNNLIIESRYDGILCEYDLLVASQFLIYHIGKVLNIDISKPKYSEDAMKIYFYKGNL